MSEQDQQLKKPSGYWRVVTLSEYRYAKERGLTVMRLNDSNDNAAWVYFIQLGEP